MSKEVPDGQAGGHRGMAGGQILLSNLGFEEGHEHEESQEKILTIFTDRMMRLFSGSDEQ